MHSANHKVRRDLETADKTEHHAGILNWCHYADCILWAENMYAKDWLPFEASGSSTSGKFLGVQRSGKYQDFPSKVRDELLCLVPYTMKTEEQHRRCLFGFWNQHTSNLGLLFRFIYWITSKVIGLDLEKSEKGSSYDISCPTMWTFWPSRIRRLI